MDEPLVPVFRTDNPGVVPLAKMALEEAGIEFVFRLLRDVNESWRRQRTEFDLDVPGEIVVRPADAARARELLADLEGGAAIVPASAEAERKATPPTAQDRTCTIALLDLETNRPLGAISSEDLQLLIDLLEEPIDDTPEYYIDASTIDMLERAGAHAGFLALLRGALAGRDGMDVRCSGR